MNHWANVAGEGPEVVDLSFREFRLSARSTCSARREAWLLASVISNRVSPTVNLAGTCKGRLPIGLQLLGKALDEARVLQIAHAYEQSTDWHKARPPIASTTLE